MKTELQQAIEWGWDTWEEMLDDADLCDELGKGHENDAAQWRHSAVQLHTLIEAAKEYQAIEKLAKQGLPANKKQISK